MTEPLAYEQVEIIRNKLRPIGSEDVDPLITTVESLKEESKKDWTNFGAISSQLCNLQRENAKLKEEIKLLNKIMLGMKR